MKLIALKGTSHPDCKQVEQLLEHKISAVREKITALRSLERDLQRAKAHCESNLSNQSNGKVPDCPVLNGISQTRGGKKR
jgi:MerR, DNA binding